MTQILTRIEKIEDSYQKGFTLKYKYENIALKQEIRKYCEKNGIKEVRGK